MTSANVFCKRNVRHVVEIGDFHVITFYDVRIVEYNPHLDSVVLRAYNSRTPLDNWYSATTKRHINDSLAAFGVPLRVFSKDFTWYVRNMNSGEVIPFTNAANFYFGE